MSGFDKPKNQVSEILDGSEACCDLRRSGGNQDRDYAHRPEDIEKISDDHLNRVAVHDG